METSVEHDVLLLRPLPQRFVELIHDWVKSYERTWSERSTSWTPCWGSSSETRKEMGVTSSGTATVTLPTDEQILITREFDAPKHLVYKAWTTPELVKRWWHANRSEVASSRSTCASAASGGT